MKLVSENAKVADRYINVKYEKCISFINNGDLFNAGVYYYSLAVFRDKIVRDYKLKYILEWEKDLLLSNLSYMIVRINELVEVKQNETISKCNGNL